MGPTIRIPRNIRKAPQPRWRRLPLILSTVAAALLLSGVSGPLAAQSQRFELDPGAAAVFNLAGTIEVVRGTGPTVVVEVQTMGPDAGQLSIQVDRIEGRESLRVIFPGDEVSFDDGGGQGRSQIRVEDDGTFGRRGGGDRVTVRRGDGGGTQAHANLRVLVPAGADLQAYLGVGEASADGVDGAILLDVASGPTSVSNASGIIEVDTGSGTIAATDIRGTLGLDTGSGRVDVAGFEGDALEIDTGSGGVTVTSATATSVGIDTGSGRVDMSAIRAPEIEIDTGSGSIDIELLAAVVSLVADTGSGSVTITAPAALSAEVVLDTGSGRVNSDFEIEGRVERRTARGQIGGGSGSIRIDSGSGSITLARGG